MTSENWAIADVQSRLDRRNLPISHVGVKGLKHPLALLNRDKTVQYTVGDFAMTVGLPGDIKGTHMSRFVELLNEQEITLSVQSLGTLLDSMLTRLNAASGRLQVSFPFFMLKKAPISAVKSLLDYQITMTAELKQQLLELNLEVVVPITSLCPCSKEISAYGAHNQRSHVTLAVTVDPSMSLWLEDLIELVEKEASCELYGLLKRSDEKYVTERAYDNPKFVEDLVRDIAQALSQLPQIQHFSVESENFESIHNHSAYALLHSGQGKHI